MTQSIVLELQTQALDSGSDIVELVRKAYAVATKLGLEDFRNWAKSELDGTLGRNVEVPPYRILQAQLRAWNPVRGCWIPVMSEDHKETESLEQAPVGMPLSQIQELAAAKGKGESEMPFPASIKNQLMRSSDLPIEPTRLFDRYQLVALLDAVRNIVLEWTLELERQGILGEGISFSLEERKKAQTTQSLHIGNLIQGDVIGSAFGPGAAAVVRDISVLRQAIEASPIPEQDAKDSLKRALDQVEREDISNDDRADLLEIFNKLRLELEKDVHEPNRIARFWKGVKDIAPTVGSLLASGKTIGEFLKIAGVL